MADARLELTTPVARPSEAFYEVDEVRISRSGPIVAVRLSVQDSVGNETRLEQLNIPDPNHGAAAGTVVGCIGALIAPRVGESGSAARRANFRILGYLSDIGRITGATLTA